MDSQSKNKKKKADESENLKGELDLIIAEPKATNKNELYLFSSEILSFQNIVSSTKRNLDTLVVIKQSGITSLNGISELINLRELWVVECEFLKDISELRESTKLETLYLYSNDISQVPNMSNSPELKLLSLSWNKISQLQNFHTMPKLQELYIANNRIKKIGNAFWQNSYLSLINLTGNPLYELKDIQNLSFIASLRSVVLVDSMYSESPLVTLCNYRQFLINYLPGLTELDYYPISNEERSYVTGFFKSKMMFYDMLCNKYVNEFTKSFKDRLKESRQRISQCREEIHLAKMTELRVEFLTSNNEIQEISYIILMPEQISESKDVHGKSGELLYHEILQQIYHSIDANDALDKQWIDNARLNLQTLQWQLSLKVQHCGNMDFVEYLPGGGNKLVKICQDICNDSLCRTIKKDLGITSIRVHRVTKIVNNETDAYRSSRHYNEKMNQDQRESDYVFKFLVRPIGVVEQLKWPLDIFEQEFLDATEIITSDCLAAADANWIKRISSQQRSSPSLVCSLSEHRLAIFVQLPVPASTMIVERPDDYHAMHPDYDKDTCQCVSVSDSEQVKPVFAVEFEYIFQNTSEKDISNERNSTKVATTVPQNPWFSLNSENLGHCLDSTELEVHKLRIINLSGRGICAIDLTMPLPNLRELYLSFNKLTALPDSAMLKYVKKLDVSFNDIQSFEITTCLSSLESLNAEWNLAIEFLTILQTLKIFTPNLVSLNLKYNPFIDVIEIESMSLLARNAMPFLKSFNENMMKKSIASRIVYRNPWIIDIFEKADLAKLKIMRNSMPGIISECNKSLTSLSSVDIEKESKNIQYINLSNNNLCSVEFVTEFPELRELYLGNNLLLKIVIERPVNHLTKLNLSANFIMTLEGLTQENFPVLNYLDLSNNLITSLIVMAIFPSLSQFYCSHNRISRIQEIYNLKDWHGLKIIDISNNPIDSMSLCNKFIIFHISKIEYVGGESVTASDVLEANQTFGGSLDKDTIMNMCNMADLKYLKQLSLVNCAIKKVDLTADLLPNLKSLDLSRNEITTLWGLHSLKKLQVLCLSRNQVATSMPNIRQDLDSTECSLFPSLNTLFLDYNSIRSLVDFKLQDMPALKYLYLQHNELQDVNGLQKCANLETLVLDYNKIKIITEEDFHTDNNIKALFLENNKIKFLSFAKRLSKINRLFISNNKIVDKEQLKYLGKLEHLKEITILGNALCKRTNHYKLAVQAVVTLTRIDGHSVILNEYDTV